MDVSIIIPTYNRLWSLPHTIDSCRNTICKTEIIVIDDGSDDGTWEWLQLQNDIVALRQENWGKCWAVNRGFTLAKGKYVRFLDSDDLLNRNAIDEQFKIAEKTLCDVVVSGFKLIDQKNTVIKEQKWIATDDFIAQQLGECDSSHYSAYLFRKILIEDVPHRPDFSFRDDRLFVLEVALKYPKIAIHEGVALHHRSHKRERLQFTDGTKHIIQNQQHALVYEKILARLEVMGELTSRRKAAAAKVLWPLAHWIAKYNIDEAYRLIKWIYNLDPEFDMPETGLLRTLYARLGFRKTEQLLKLRRLFLF